MNKDEIGKQPLWLPKGSVRAIIALSLVLPVPASVIVGLIRGNILEIPAGPLALASAVAVYYFEKRKEASNEKKS